MSSTQIDVIEAILAEYGAAGVALNADSVGAASIVDASEFALTSYSSEEMRGRGVWRPTATSAADYFRLITTIDTSTGTATVGGPNYIDQTTTYYILLPRGLHYQTFIDAITQAQTRALVPLQRALVQGTDMDMETTGVAYWDGTSGQSSLSNATVSKSTAAADNFRSRQSLVVQCTAASGAVSSEIQRVPAGQRSIYTAICGRADVGTLKFRLWDITNGAFINTGQDVSYTGENWAILERTDQLPSGCEEIQYVFQGSGASDRMVITTCFGPYVNGQSVFDLPAEVDASRKFKVLRPVRHRVPIAGQNGCYDAYSDYPSGDEDYGLEYTIVNYPREVNPNKLQLTGANRLTPASPVHYIYERYSYDCEPLTSATSTTVLTLGPDDGLMPFVMDEFYNKLLSTPRGKQDSDLQRRSQKMSLHVEAVVEAKPKTVIAPKQYHSYGSARL